jgi:ribosomal protein S11
MMARNRRYRKNRTAALGIATAAVLGGGAIAVAAVASAPGSHPAGFVAAPAAHTVRLASQGTMLSTALADWNSARQGSYAELAQMTSARGFSQSSHHGKTLDIQRGIVVLATNQFVILQSANGSLHLWLVSGGTKFQNVSGTTAGTAALTASTSATQQAMQSGNMIPATTLLAGSPTTAAAMLTPTAVPQTVTVQVAGTDLTVTVTVTRSTAAVTQTATTPANATPAPMTSTFAMNAWQPANSLARGDLAVIVGTRSHQTLHAQLVLFSPLTTSAVGGTTGSGLTKLAAKPSTAPTHW